MVSGFITEVSGFITTWSQDNPQTTLAYQPVDVNEVTLTFIANTQHSTLSTASVLALAYRIPAISTAESPHYEVIEYFQETQRRHHMCSQALCYSYGMASTMSVLPASLMSTAHKAMQGTSIIAAAHSILQNNARALARNASKRTGFNFHSSTHSVHFVLRPTFSINHLPSSTCQKADDIQ